VVDSVVAIERAVPAAFRHGDMPGCRDICYTLATAPITLGLSGRPLREYARARETLGETTDTGDVPLSAGHSPRALSAAHRGGAPRRRRPRRAFSLIEVVLVIVILGVIAAIAIPRLSRGSQGSADAACARDVQVLQKAIDLYAAEHNGAFPNAAMIADQLTLYSDHAGSTSQAKSPAYPFGPYLRKVPAVPTGPNKGATNISTAPGVGVGWIYDPTEGTITVNDAGQPTTSPSPG
jgi:prepilin-type N-terminal cleavage/methylation domain-containing protein